MAIYPRNLLLFLALSGVAFATWMFARDPGLPAPAGAESGPAPRSYYSTDAVLHGTDEQGRIFYRVLAERLEQQPESENLLLDGIRVEYTPDSGIRFSLTAAAGQMLADRSVFRLQEATLVYTPGGGADEITFETGSLQLDARRLLASTDEPVVFRQDGTELFADGFEADLEAGTWELDNATSDTTR